MFEDFMKVSNSAQAVFEDEMDKSYWVKEIEQLKSDLIAAGKLINAGDISAKFQAYN
jgi:hypothetical protein